MSPNTVKPRLWAVIPAAGSGKRFQSTVPKQYLPLAGKPLIAQTLLALLAYPGIEKVVVAITAHDSYWPDVAAMLPADKLQTVVGGAERLLSVQQGLLALTDAHKDDWVLVHDAVRPCIKLQDIANLMHALEDHPVGGLLGVRVSDTLKRTDDEGRVLVTIDRTNVWRAQTPQVFRYGLLRQALQTAVENDMLVTDEAGAIEFIGEQPLMVAGSSDNIKVTYPEDFQRAEQFFSGSAGSLPAF